MEVIIPCHSTDRPLERAVISALDQARDVQVTVVAHNLPIRDLKAAVDPNVSARVNWLQLSDGIASPAGPFMHAMNRSNAEWIVRLDSDDWMEDGAIESWLEKSGGADAVVPNLRYDTGEAVKTPPQRPWPLRWRNAVKDRLYYRSAPLGLLRRSFLETHGLHLDLGVRTGEDLRMSSLLWSKGRVRTNLGGPSYVVGTGSPDRVTDSSGPLSEDFAPILEAWIAGWATELPCKQKSALATKYLRVHVFGAAYYRAIRDDWQEGDREVLAATSEAILRQAPSAAWPLSVADNRLLEALQDEEVPTQEVSRLALRRRMFGRWDTLLPQKVGRLFDREAPLRFMTASLLVR